MGGVGMRTAKQSAGIIREAGLGYRIRKNWQNYVLMAPYLLLFFLFTLLPVLIAIVVSFTDYDLLTKPEFAGFDNYIRMLLDDDINLIAVKNTLIFALVTGPVSYLLCFFFAWLINDLTPWLRAVVTALFYAPVLSGQAYTVWRFIFSSDSYGILNGFLMRFGLIREPIGWLTDATYTLGVVIAVQLWLSLGTGFLAFIAGLHSVDRSLYEAGVIDGVHNRFQEVWFITLPTMKPQLLFGAVMQIVTSFSVADVSAQLAGFPSTEYNAETAVTHIMDYGLVRYEMGYACALATVLFLAMLLSNRLVTAALNRVGR